MGVRGRMSENNMEVNLIQFWSCLTQSAWIEALYNFARLNDNYT